MCMLLSFVSHWNCIYFSLLLACLLAVGHHVTPNDLLDLERMLPLLWCLCLIARYLATVLFISAWYWPSEEARFNPKDPRNLAPWRHKGNENELPEFKADKQQEKTVASTAIVEMKQLKIDIPAMNAQNANNAVVQNNGQISRLGRDTLILIFRLLGADTVCQVARVSKTWAEYSRQDILSSRFSIDYHICWPTERRICGPLGRKRLQCQVFFAYHTSIFNVVVQWADRRLTKYTRSNCFGKQ